MIDLILSAAAFIGLVGLAYALGTWLGRSAVTHNLTAYYRRGQPKAYIVEAPGTQGSRSGSFTGTISPRAMRSYAKRNRLDYLIIPTAHLKRSR